MTSVLGARSDRARRVEPRRQIQSIHGSRAMAILYGLSLVLPQAGEAGSRNEFTKSFSSAVAIFGSPCQRCLGRVQLQHNSPSPAETSLSASCHTASIRKTWPAQSISPPGFDNHALRRPLQPSIRMSDNVNQTSIMLTLRNSPAESTRVRCRRLVGTRSRVNTGW